MTELIINTLRASTATRRATAAGLLLATLGIIVMSAAGLVFPVVFPLVILLATALAVGFARWQWAPGIGVAIGLFVLVGFLVSPSGLRNLSGGAGAGVAIGQALEVIGLLTAVVAGAISTSQTYRHQVQNRQ